MISAPEQVLDFPSYVSDWQVYPKDSIASVPFRFKPAQVLMEDAIRAQEQARQPVRVAILKFRQATCSTFCTARMQWRAQTRPGHTGMSIADKLQLPGAWLDRARIWHEQLEPAFLQPRMETPGLQLYYPDIGSRYIFGSAEGKTPGVGSTLADFHGSECALWLHPEEIRRRTFQGIPTSPNSMILLESTGEMLGDWWSELWLAAQRGENDFAAVFLPWKLAPEYRMDPHGELLDLSDREQALVRLGYDREQLAWRRWKIRNEFGGSEDEFANQFPSTPEEAFLAGGKQVFKEQLDIAHGTVREPRWRGDIIPRPGRPAEFDLVGSDAGSLLIYDHDPREGELPKDRHNFIIGADVQWSTKISVSVRSEQRETDYDAAVGVDCETRQTCLALHGRFDFGEYAERLAALGWYYRGAMLAPERNSRGEALVNILKGRMSNNWRYPRVYRRKGS